jgi:hypothetical protein
MIWRVFQNFPIWLGSQHDRDCILPKGSPWQTTGCANAYRSPLHEMPVTGTEIRIKKNVLASSQLQTEGRYATCLLLFAWRRGGNRIKRRMAGAKVLTF